MRTAAIQGLLGAMLVGAGVAAIDWRLGMVALGAVIFLDYAIGQIRRRPDR